MAKKRTAADKLAAQPPDVERDVELQRARSDTKGARLRYREATRRIDALEKRIEFLTALRKPKRTKLQAQRQADGEAAAVLGLCDWHSGEDVRPEMVNSLNEFRGLDTARQRVTRAFEKAPRLLAVCRKLSVIDEFIVWLGGDLVSGYIHDELEENNTCGPAEEWLFVRDAIVSGLDFLSKELKVKRFRVVCSFGNHARTTEQIRHATAYKSNWEWLLYSDLARLYEEVGSPIEWHVVPSYFNTQDIKGNQVRFHHGNYIRYQGGVGGITIPANKAFAQWNKGKRADYDVVAHWHQSLRLPRAVFCGCLVGYNPFALSIKAEYEEATQTFLVFDRAKGLVFAERVFVE